MMTGYREKVQKRAWLAIVFCALWALAVGLLTYHVFAGDNDPGDAFGGFIAGVQTGIFLMLLVFFLAYAWRAFRALRSNEALKARYIAEQDERSAFIRDKIGGIGLNAIIVLLGMAVIISGFFNRTAFATLLVTLAVVVFIKAGLKAYFWQKF